MIRESGEILLLDFGTSIFSKSEDPHEREKIVLLETGKKILTEERFQFLDNDSLLQSPSECVPYALDALTRILEILHKFEKTEEYDQNDLTVFCAHFIAFVPFFKILRFIEIFKQNGVEYPYLINFFSISYSICKSYLPPSDKWETDWIEMSDENLDKFFQLYSSWKEEFIIRVQNGDLNI